MHRGAFVTLSSSRIKTFSLETIECVLVVYNGTAILYNGLFIIYNGSAIIYNKLVQSEWNHRKIADDVDIILNSDVKNPVVGSGAFSGYHVFST